MPIDQISQLLHFLDRYAVNFDPVSWDGLPCLVRDAGLTPGMSGTGCLGKMISGIMECIEASLIYR